MLPLSTPRHERDAFAREFLAARKEDPTDPEARKAAYRSLLARQGGFAKAHYRLAQLLERAGSWNEAYQHYVAARDLDGFPIRPVRPSFRMCIAKWPIGMAAF